MTIPIAIREAPEVESIAEGLIVDQADHEHLRRARILYLFTSQKRKKCDRVRLGSAAKLSALQRFLSSGLESVAEGHDFIVLIADAEWRLLTQAQRSALVDHELMHCAEFVTYTKRGVGKRRWGLRGHDVEEFKAVIERHGLWKPDVQSFAEAARQLSLGEAEPPREREAVPA